MADFRIEYRRAWWPRWRLLSTAPSASICSEKDEDLFLEFEATVTKRAHTRVRHSEHGDSVVSSARLAITNLDADED